MLFIKIHKSYRSIVAICDSNLIGKYFEEPFNNETKCLEVRESFFKGEEVSYDKAVKILRSEGEEDSTFNIIGSEAVKAAKEAEIIDDKAIGTVQDIPFALVLL